MVEGRGEQLCWVYRLAFILLNSALQVGAEASQEAYFLPEFALSPQGTFQEDSAGEHLLTYRYDDQASRITRSDEDRNTGWDAWGTWSDCSRTCGGGASYSLRRCLSGTCDGRNIRYRTCSNMECPADSGDFRAQQCVAHNDMRYQGRTYEWSPASHDPAAPCALKCQARGEGLVVELAPKVLDGTRCRNDSLNMCINGVCEEVGCDHQLGSNAREDNCGVCAGDGATCRLVRGQVLSHVSVEEPFKSVVEIPLGSRHVRVSAKGPDVLVVETHTLQGHREEHSPSTPGTYMMANTTVDVQKGQDRLSIRTAGPLSVDFIIKVRYTAPRNTLVQFGFYQPLRYQWRETDFFPCTVTCGGGYQLNSAECMDTRLSRAVPDHHCHTHPENKKPKPKLRECAMDPCPESDGFKEVMPYDHFQPLPRWEQTPWTICSASCGGGSQTRSVWCVEEDSLGQASPVEEWKCLHSGRPITRQDCNTFSCPQWAAMDWSQCTVTCGRGLRYRVVLCLDHRGQHAGGCETGLKPHVKEDCLVPVTCYKPREKLPVEAKLPWLKQAQELEETRVASEDPTFVTGPWLPCSTSCGPGRQSRWVRCRVLLSFTRTEVDLPDEECRGRRPSAHRVCDGGPCGRPHNKGTDYKWESAGFTACSSTCATGKQEAVVQCLNKDSRAVVDEALCNKSSRPPKTFRTCSTQPCPPRWEPGPWTQCTATCGVGIQTRSIHCKQLRLLDPEDTVVVSDQVCPEFKPPVLRACNQVDCPAAWEAEEWQQCSHTCGGGTQSRKVFCKQNLTTGGFQKLPDASCEGIRPATHKPCDLSACPAQLVGGDWSKCSVTCGTGVQRRESVCRRRTAAGQEVTMSRAACQNLPPPPLIRTCRMNACPKPPKTMKPKEPHILGFSRICIQTLEEKRVQLLVGGHAYLLPKTSAVIRCPVRRFPKTFVKWEKDGRILLNTGHLGIMSSGSLKIQEFGASDVGVYRCVAGPVSETLVLKLIGEFNILTGSFKERGSSTEVDHLQKMWNHFSRSWQKNPTGDHELDQDKAFWQVLDSHLRSLAAISETQLRVSQGIHCIENQHFEQLVKNMSWMILNNGNVKIKNVTLQFQSQPAASSSLQFASEKRTTPGVEDIARNNSIQRPPNSSEEALGENSFIQRKPVIVAPKHHFLMDLQGNIKASIGQNVALSNNTRNVYLICPAQGVPEPNITWTKDGEPLRLTNRVTWDSSGGLHISDLMLTDVGLYQCSATNALGSDTQSSRLLLAGPSTRVRSHFHLQNHRRVLMASHLGSNVTAWPGDLLRIGCPIHSHHREPIRWYFQNFTLQEALGKWYRLLVGGRVLEVNAFSRKFEGTYQCQSASRSRTVSAWIHVKPEAFTWQHGAWMFCSASCGDRGVQARRLHCTASGGQEVPLALCHHHPPPVILTQACNIRNCPPSWDVTTWSECSAPCGGGTRRRRVRCQQREARGTVRVLPESACGRGLRPADREECNSLTCGARQCSGWCIGNALAVQRPPAVCRHPNGSALPQPQCEHTSRTPLRPNCSWDECSSGWKVGPWRACSAACGSGFQSRRVECVHRQTGRTLPPKLCAWQQRPVTWKHCRTSACGDSCRDSTHYCGAVRQLRLCAVGVYRLRCCQTCQGASTPSP